MPGKKSLLFVTTELPWPADSGGRIKSFRLIQFLSLHFDLKLVCAHGAKDGNTLRVFRDASGVKSVQVFDTFRKRTAYNWFLAIMQFPTFNSFRVYSKRMETMLKWGIEKSDIVVIDHLEMFEMIDVKMVSKVIYHSHNAEFKLWSDYAHISKNPLKKWLLSWEAQRVKLFEQWVIKKALFTFMAPNDSTLLMEESSIDSDKSKLTYHLGNDQLLDKPAVDIDSTKKQLFYSGTLSWTPNSYGMEWFISEVWPLINKSQPDAHIEICGRGASKSLLSLMQLANGVNYRGYVDDLEPIMNESRCAVVPLRFGSGMKIKTFDAMYKGLPVVSTTSGAEGIDVKSGEHLFIANDPETFAKNVIQLLEDPSLCKSLGANARSLVQKEYTYANIFEHMLTDINNAYEFQS